MSFNDCKISESQIQTTGVQSQPDTLTGSAADNKMVFDALPTLVIQKLNSLIDQMQQQAAAGQVGVTPFDGMTAQTLQDALEQIQADIGGNYSGADGAGKVGYTPSEGVDEDTVQEAIEAVQANLTAYIAKIKAATGAAEVGNAPIAGMTATNVQQALEELRENIDNIVSGIIPGGSITSDMLQDGAVTADKLGSDVTGEEIPTSASDPTSISSQLSKKAEWMPNNWKTEADAPSAYPLNSATTFFSGNSFAGIDQCIVTTYAYNLNAARQIVSFLDNTGVKYRLAIGEDQWGAWKQISTATPPQVFDLPLWYGWTEHRASEYFKTQENIVTVYFQVHTSSPQGGEVTVATLPEGFRPQNAIGGSGYCGIPGEKYAPADVKVYPNGNITGFNDVGAAEYYTGFFTFGAAG